MIAFLYCNNKHKQITLYYFIAYFHLDFVFTHILKHENETEVYGTICCHVNNILTFWSTKSEKSCFLVENEYHAINSSIKYMKWFQISNELCKYI